MNPIYLLLLIFIVPTCLKWSLIGYWHFRDRNKKIIPHGEEYNLEHEDYNHLK